MTQISRRPNPIRSGVRRLRAWLAGPFRGSEIYWRERYSAGGTSGPGSYNHLAMFKAEVLNAFVTDEQIASIIEFGCGDGNQLSLAQYPAYLGLDVSPAAIDQCRERFAGDKTKQFKLIADYADEQAELAISLDVIYHLVEDDVFEMYMRRLFRAATRYVMIYSSDTDQMISRTSPYIKHRQFSKWIAANAPQWQLVKTIPNRYPWDGHDAKTTSFADFFIYRLAE